MDSSQRRREGRDGGSCVNKPVVVKEEKTEEEGGTYGRGGEGEGVTRIGGWRVVRDRQVAMHDIRE